MGKLGGALIDEPQRAVGPRHDPDRRADAGAGVVGDRPDGGDPPDRVISVVGEPQRAVRTHQDPIRGFDAGVGVVDSGPNRRCSRRSDDRPASTHAAATASAHAASRRARCRHPSGPIDSPTKHTKLPTRSPNLATGRRHRPKPFKARRTAHANPAHQKRRRPRKSTEPVSSLGRCAEPCDRPPMPIKRSRGPQVHSPACRTSPTSGGRASLEAMILPPAARTPVRPAVAVLCCDGRTNGVFGLVGRALGSRLPRGSLRLALSIPTARRPQIQ